MQDVTYVLAVTALGTATGATLAQQTPQTRQTFAEALGRLCKAVGIDVQMQRVMPVKSIVDGYGKQQGRN